MNKHSWKLSSSCLIVCITLYVCLYIFFTYGFLAKIKENENEMKWLHVAVSGTLSSICRGPLGHRVQARRILNRRVLGCRYPVLDYTFVSFILILRILLLVVRYLPRSSGKQSFGIQSSDAHWSRSGFAKSFSSSKETRHMWGSGKGKQKNG